MIIKPYNRADPNPKLINHSEEKERGGRRTKKYTITVASYLLLIIDKGVIVVSTEWQPSKPQSTKPPNSKGSYRRLAWPTSWVYNMLQSQPDSVNPSSWTHRHCLVQSMRRNTDLFVLSHQISSAIPDSIYSRGLRRFLTRMTIWGCLKLNVYAPADAVLSRQKLPVLVWIHGGGLAIKNGNADFSMLALLTCHHLFFLV